MTSLFLFVEMTALVTAAVILLACLAGALRTQNERLRKTK
jgi:hypothetical protein